METGNIDDQIFKFQVCYLVSILENNVFQNDEGNFKALLGSAWDLLRMPILEFYILNKLPRKAVRR